MADIFPNLIKIINSPIPETQEPWKKTTWKHILIKLLKTNDKEENVNVASVQKDYIQRNKGKDEGRFLIGNHESEKLVPWSFSKYWKEKELSIWNLYPMKITFKNEGNRLLKRNKHWKNSSPALR